MSKIRTRERPPGYKATCEQARESSPLRQDANTRSGEATSETTDGRRRQRGALHANSQVASRSESKNRDPRGEKPITCHLNQVTKAGVINTGCTAIMPTGSTGKTHHFWGICTENACPESNQDTLDKQGTFNKLNDLL